MSQLRAVLAIFHRPVRGFTDLLAEPKSLLAVLILMVAAGASHAVISSRLDQGAMVRATAERMTEEGRGKDMSEKDLVSEATRRINVTRIFGYVLILGGVPLLILFVAAVLWFLGRFSKDRIRFKGCWALAAHIWLPLGLRHLMSIPVILTYPSLDPFRVRGLFRTDIGSLFGSGAPGLSLIDLFWIWIAVLFFLAGRTAGWGWLRSIVGGVMMFSLLGLAGRFLI
jgi:hypothetical protein